MHPARSYAFNRHVSVQKHMIVYNIPCESNLFLLSLEFENK